MTTTSSWAPPGARPRSVVVLGRTRQQPPQDIVLREQGGKSVFQPRVYLNACAGDSISSTRRANLENRQDRCTLLCV